jgi:hypothetical protein
MSIFLGTVSPDSLFVECLGKAINLPKIMSAA